MRITDLMRSALRGSKGLLGQDLNRLSGTEWTLVLAINPALGKRCDWNKLSDMDWAWLLVDFPDFADECKLQCWSKHSWFTLIKARPHMSSWWDFRGGERDLAELSVYAVYPQFSLYESL